MQCTQRGLPNWSTHGERLKSKIQCFNQKQELVKHGKAKNQGKQPRWAEGEKSIKQFKKAMHEKTE